MHRHTYVYERALANASQSYRQHPTFSMITEAAAAAATAAATAIVNQTKANITLMV